MKADLIVENFGTVKVEVTPGPALTMIFASEKARTEAANEAAEALAKVAANLAKEQVLALFANPSK